MRRITRLCRRLVSAASIPTAAVAPVPSQTSCRPAVPLAIMSTARCVQMGSTRPAAYTATVRRKTATSSHFRNHREPQTHAHPNSLAAFTLVEPLIFVLAPSVLASPRRGAPPPARRAPR